MAYEPQWSKNKLPSWQLLLYSLEGTWVGTHKAVQGWGKFRGDPSLPGVEIGAWNLVPITHPILKEPIRIFLYFYFTFSSLPLPLFLVPFLWIPGLCGDKERWEGKRSWRSQFGLIQRERDWVLCCHKTERVCWTNWICAGGLFWEASLEEEQSPIVFFFSMVMELSFGRGVTPQTSLLENALVGEKLLSSPLWWASGMLGEGLLQRVEVWWGGRELAVTWPSAECKHRAKCFCIAARNSDSFDFNFDVSIFLMTHW